MENRVIKYLEKYYCIFLNVIYILTLGILFMKLIKEKIVFLAVLLALLILFFIVLSIIFYNYSIIFDYKKLMIKALEPGHYHFLKIKMNEIKQIKFYEAKTEKKNSAMIFERRLYNFYPVYVYNYGRKYFIEIVKTNGKIIKIEYNSLYKCKNSYTIETFENKVNTIIKEFNNFKYKNYIKNKV